MIPTVLGIGAITLGISLAGLLVFGTRWSRAGVARSAGYAVAVVTPAYEIGSRIWRLPTGNLVTACTVFLVVILAVSSLERDWNPPSQALIGVLATNCVAFTIFTVIFALSGQLAGPAIPAALFVSALEIFAFVLLLIGTHEALDVAGRVRWHRRNPGPLDPTYLPFVSIHVPIHNEPPELVVETLRALQNLNYPDFEVLVIDNNTEDEALWRPIEQYCEGTGFRFVHLEDWPGFKAGALNHALEMTDVRADVIAVVDADFIVAPDFLSQCAPHFSDPSVAIVQTAQDFRTESDSRYFRRLKLTYRAFDEVTMPGRNERNAIIFAGTMGLLRRSLIEKVGRWAEWCVTEDAELSVRILARGGASIYLERSFGRGVMPLTFGALKRQRFRWCFGGIQILRRHWRLMVFGKGTAEDGAPLVLTRAQRYGYLAAALQWFQPLLTVTMSALLMLGVISASLGHPVAIRPLVGFFIATPAMLLLVGVTKSLWGLRARLHVGWVDALGALGIWFALSWAVAVASFKALLRREGAFLRTPKFAEGQSLRQAVSETRSEIVVAATMAIGAALAVRSIGGADGWFLASLCLWGALVIGSAPVAAFSAARADLGTVGLQQRRRLEWTRGHSPWRRRSSRFVAVMGVAAGLVLLLGASLGGGQGGSTLGALSGQLVLPHEVIPQKTTVHAVRAAAGGAASVSSIGSGSALPQQAPSSPLVTRGTSSPASSSAPTPTVKPSRNPSAAPSASSSPRPSATPSARPTGTPSRTPTSIPTPTGIPSHSHVATGSSLMFETVASGSSGQGSAALLLLIVPFLGAVASRRASRPRAPGTGKLRVVRGRQEE